MDKRIAIIGAGYWGANLVRVFHQLGALYRVCDFSASRLQELSVKYPDVKMDGRCDEVLTDSNVDAVVIATPAETHYDLASRALLAGKDVYVEKPLTLHCEEAEKLTALAESRGQVLMVGHLLEYHPAITCLDKLIEQGELGRLEYIYSNRLNMGKVRREEEAADLRQEDRPGERPVRDGTTGGADDRVPRGRAARARVPALPPLRDDASDAQNRWPRWLARAEGARGEPAVTDDERRAGAVRATSIPSPWQCVSLTFALPAGWLLRAYC